VTDNSNETPASPLEQARQLLGRCEVGAALALAADLEQRCGDDIDPWRCATSFTDAPGRRLSARICSRCSAVHLPRARRGFFCNPIFCASIDVLHFTALAPRARITSTMLRN
jgi:hypothetical protein